MSDKQSDQFKVFRAIMLHGSVDAVRKAGEDVPDLPSNQPSTSRGEFPLAAPFLRRYPDEFTDDEQNQIKGFLRDANETLPNRVASYEQLIAGRESWLLRVLSGVAPLGVRPRNLFERDFFRHFKG
jgi:hypothetical protein